VRQVLRPDGFITDKRASSPRTPCSASRKHAATLRKSALEPFDHIANARASRGCDERAAHRERVMRWLDIHSMAGLIKFAIAHGLVSLEDYEPRT